MKEKQNVDSSQSNRYVSGNGKCILKNRLKLLSVRPAVLSLV